MNGLSTEPRLSRIFLPFQRFIVGGALRFAIKFLYSIKVNGLENVASVGQPAIYVANHVSLLDGLMIGLLLPGNPVFVINTHIAKKWWAHFFVRLTDYYTLDPINPLSLKSLIRVIEKGRAVVIFPEGRLTDTGALMKVYDGPGLIADKTRAPIIPVRIDGAEYTPFSYMNDKLPRRWFTKIVITILKPVILDVPDHYKERVRRQYIADKLYSIMSSGKLDTAHLDKTLWQSLLESSKQYGDKTIVMDDIEQEPVTYKKLIMTALIMGGHFKKITQDNENIGFLLPNMAITGSVFFALQAFGRVPVMLNPSSSKERLARGCAVTQVKTIITSRRFIKVAHLDEIIGVLSANHNIIYLEDLRRELHAIDYIKGYFKSFFPEKTGSAKKADDTAVILFTAGKCGEPKAVALSHRNMLANRHQIAACIDCTPKDTVFNPLPLFTPYGLVTGFLIPLYSGAKTFLFPSPLQYQFVSELVYDSKSTILFGTNTSLLRYAEAAHPYDFYRIRYVFSGAEKLTDETRQIWAEKFGLRILEGYGAAEASPILAMNTPMYNKSNTVGKFLPGIEYKIEPVEGHPEGGALFVRGPNIMKGYVTQECLDQPSDGWVSTGDIVRIHDDGFVSLIGRTCPYVTEKTGL